MGGGHADRTATASGQHRTTACSRRGLGASTCWSPRRASVFAWYHEDAPSGDGTNESFGAQNVEGLLGGALGYLVALHDGLDARQGLARAYLTGLDHSSQERGHLQVPGLIAEMINGHPARLGIQGGP